MAAHVPATLLYVLLTIGLTWPLAGAVASLVPHDLGDPLLTVWTLWWNAHVLPFSAAWWNGPVFFPAPYTLTFSDHRVGLGLIATPLMWLGASPLAAHNVAFLLSFPLSAVAAYALCFSLTGSRAAAFVGGLVFGFNPFRAGHLPHLELLSSYWLPVVLLALHRWAATRSVRWLVVLAVSLTLQALTCGYYFVFSGVLLALWLLWFTPRNLVPRRYVELAVALATPLAVVAPVFLKYREAHAAMGLSRSITDIEQLSADLVGFVTPAVPLALWEAPAAWQSLEGAVFPGATAVLLVAAAWWTTRQPAPVARRWSLLRAIVLALACLMVVIGLVPTVFGPVSFDAGGLRISVSAAYKPLSIAAMLAMGWGLTTPRVRRAWRTRSMLAFYALATLAMWCLALGPTARLLGTRVLYKAPYAWLMTLPGFADEFRAPARFAMLATLTLGVAAALAFDRLVKRRPETVRTVAVCLVSAAIVAESWIHPFPLRSPPEALVVPEGVPADAVVLELPLGILEDAAAMYRSIGHQRSTVNGMSGYEPPHYGVLRAAMEDDEVGVLDALATAAPIAIFVSRDRSGAGIAAALAAQTRARPLATTARHHVWLLPGPREATREATCRESLVTPSSLHSAANADDLPKTLDGNRLTAWTGTGPQRGGEQISADLGHVRPIAGIVLAQGPFTTAFPRAVVVEVSLDQEIWSEVWRGDTAALVLAAARDDPREIRTCLPFAAREARFVRVTQTGQSSHPWAVAELRIVPGRRD